jgi:Putative Flp pilus-assembly TadE/G-like
MKHNANMLRQLRNEKGQAIIMVTVGMVFLMGILGLVVDVGWGYYRKQVAQAAVDSAVLAAVVAAGTGTLTCGSGGVVCNPAGISCTSTAAGTNLKAGCQYGAQNGIANANMTMAADLSSNTAITGIATSYWVKATVSENLALTFLQVLGARSATVGASATAAITESGSGGGCVYALNPITDRAIWETGSGDLESSCGVWVDSTDPKAIYQTAGAIINTNSANTNLVGGYYQTGSSVITPLPVAATPVADPWTTKTLPTLPSPVVCSSVTGPSYSPGTYCGGISFSGNATFSSGLYVMDGGGFNMTGSGTVSGTGVTILLASDAGHSYKGISINGSGTVTLTAPTSGPYEAMLFIGSRSTASSLGSTITGTTNAQFTGVIYLPKEALTYTGGSNLTGYTTIISDTLKLTGLTYVKANYGSLASGNPIGGAKSFTLIQ